MGNRNGATGRHAPSTRATTAFVLGLAALVALGAPGAPRFADDAPGGDVQAVAAPVADEMDASAAAKPALLAPPAAAATTLPAAAAPAAGDTVPALAADPADTAVDEPPPVAAPRVAPGRGAIVSPAAAAAVPAAVPRPDPAASSAIARTSTLHPDPIGTADLRGASDGVAAGWTLPAAGGRTQETDPAGQVGLPPGTPEEQAIDAETVAMGGLLPENRILTYYGHPHDPNMGILGEYEKDALLQLLRAEAASYEAADPARPVLPAFEVIATVAQGWPAQDDTYLLDTDLETLVEYADFAEANGILLFLDLQIGRNTVPAEIEKVRPLLQRPHVHLALDPEFAVAEGQVPGTHIGELTAEQIGEAQDILAGIVRDNGLPPKILIVHQFTEDMILGKERLEPVAGVQLVIESDGFGAPNLKTEVYNILIPDNDNAYPGIKHFYRQDVPVMTAAETLALDPAPLLVIYQ